MSPRPGFIVQNAVTVGANLDLAEPDALDFNLLGNANFGVINGCDVVASGSGTTVRVNPGVAVVNGVLVQTQGSVDLPTSSQDSRFDLITVDSGGAVGKIVGKADPNPIFPEYDSTVTVLASVMVRSGITVIQQGDVTDKRVMLMERFATAVKDGSLVTNKDPTDLTPHFDLAWDGTFTWDGDGTTLYRFGTKSLRITDNLNVVGDVSAATVHTTGDLNVNGDIFAANFREGHGNPSGSAEYGDLYRNLNDGSIWIYQTPNQWTQLSTVPIPAGMTMTGFLSTAPAGWLLCDGSTHTKAEVGGLWNAMPAWQNVAAGTMKLPDARNCYFAWGPPGTKFGNAAPQIQIQVTNLPPHKHLASPTASAGGPHGHTVSQTSAGAHSHTTTAGQGAHIHGVNDPKHLHGPAYGGGAYIMTVWGAPNKLDGLFNDASHTYNVNPIAFTDYAETGIGITTDNSAHTHTTDQQGAHTHGFSIDTGGGTHTHPITENSVGNGTPIDIRPPSIGMYLYVKT